MPDVGTYRFHLETVILPFWLEGALDEEVGGIFTCFDNRGRRLVRDDKYVWSQGRGIWLLARAADLAQRGLISTPAERLLAQAWRSADFVMRYAVLGDNSCRYVLGRRGETREPAAPSIYTDCFVALGLAELARVAGDVSLLQRAVAIYAEASARVRSASFPAAPYPVPEGYRSFSATMILLCVAEQLCRSVGELGAAAMPFSPTDEARYWLDTMFGEFVLGDGTVRELVSASHDDETVLGRHRTPGHALEAMVFAVRSARYVGYLEGDVLTRACEVMHRALEVGWDDFYGGLFRHVDANGGVPKGVRSASTLEQLIVDTWDTKLWWPHIEAVSALRLAVELTGEPSLVGWARRLHDYTFDTFPAKEGEGREWIQIRDRAGKPTEQVVALPVKDPFHIARGLMDLIELLHTTSTTAEVGR